MIKRISVINPNKDRLDLELTRPYISGFIVERVTGLGPGKASVNVTEVGTMDGGVYNSARRNPRNIVVSLRFMPGQNIEELRQKTYKYFPLKKNIRLEIETDKRKSFIDGYVESNEPDIFSEEEGTDISILCPDPLFYSSGENGTQKTSFYGITPFFSFPFANNSIAEPKICFAGITPVSESNIYYNGDADIGMTVTLHITGDVMDILILNADTGEHMKILTDRIAAIVEPDNTETEVCGLRSQDSIRICTVKGKKSMTLLRDGKSYNILNALDKKSKWLTLSKGDNAFAFSAEYGFENVNINVENSIVYEGI